MSAAEVVVWRCSIKNLFSKFRKIRRKTLVPHKLKSATLLEKRLWHWCFPLNFAKNFKNTFSTEHVRATASSAALTGIDSPRFNVFYLRDGAAIVCRTIFFLREREREREKQLQKIFSLYYLSRKRKVPRFLKYCLFSTI